MLYVLVPMIFHSCISYCWLHHLFSWSMCMHALLMVWE